jgi:cytoskeletal protein CcmA (bactofilin family)
LAINAGVIAFFMNQQPSEDKAVSNSEVTLSSQSLDELGVSRNPVGSAGTELIVGPNSRFNGSVTIGSDVSIAGQLSLNSRFTATDASLANLQAGQTSLQDLNVNGSGTMSNLNVRNSLIVAGATQLQGAVTVSQLLTVNNSVNITGNLAVGGILSARGFQASTLVSDTTLTIGGHVITRGLAPSVSAGGAVGNNGTVSISGSDAAGTVAVNIGTGGGNGILANISFRQVYGSTPRVVVTAGGRSAGSVYVNRSATGFSINVGNSLPPGGYFFDYIVMQ